MLLLLVGIVSMFLVSCAPATDIHACIITEPRGFWYGIWNGIITPFSFIGSLFSDDITIYNVNNNGGWYDFGFLLGVGGLGFGSRGK